MLKDNLYGTIANYPNYQTIAHKIGRTHFNGYIPVVSPLVFLDMGLIIEIIYQSIMNKIEHMQ